VQHLQYFLLGSYSFWWFVDSWSNPFFDAQEAIVSQEQIRKAARPSATPLQDDPGLSYIGHYWTCALRLFSALFTIRQESSHRHWPRSPGRPVRSQDTIPMVGNPVANRHKWRIGHESVATRQTKELSNFALNFLFFFNCTNLFHYLRLMAAGTEWSKFTCFEKTCSKCI
jgi:hypothetical protein